MKVKKNADISITLSDIFGSKITQKWFLLSSTEEHTYVTIAAKKFKTHANALIPSLWEYPYVICHANWSFKIIGDYSGGVNVSIKYLLQYNSTKHYVKNVSKLMNDRLA